MAVLQTFEYFFDLPGELRRQILSYLLVKPGGILLGPVPSLPSAKEDNASIQVNLVAAGRLPSQKASANTNQHGNDEDPDEPCADDTLPWPLPYFLVSHTFHDEAAAVYFRENIFYLSPIAGGKSSGIGIRAPPRRPPSPQNRARKPAPPFAEALLDRDAWLHARRRIRHLVVYVHSRRGSFLKQVYAPLTDMILAGDLRVLEMRVSWLVTERGAQDGGSGVLGTAPMQAMYRVLSDPDLDSARLRVAVCDGKMLHDGIWCRFHQSDGKGVSLGRCPAKTGDSDGWRGSWVDVDIGKLIHMHGGIEERMKILKVG